MKNSILLLALCFAILSCSKEDNITEEINAEESAISETGLFKEFVYEGISYIVEIDENGDVIENGLDKKLLIAISSSNVVEVGSESTLYLFDDINEMDSFIIKQSLIKNSENKQMKSSGVAKSTGYQHEYFKGFPLGGTGNFAYPSLRPHGFNDLISSCIITNYSSLGYLAQYWEHDGYQGRVYSVILNPGEIKSIVNMRSVGLHDKVSSMVGRYL